jgi:hypothetical protein
MLIFHATQKYPNVIALVGLDGNGENLHPDVSKLSSITEKVMGLLDDIGHVMADDALKRFILPSCPLLSLIHERPIVHQIACRPRQRSCSQRTDT